MQRPSLLATALIAICHGGLPLAIALAPLPAAAQTANETYKQHMSNGVKLYEDKNFAAAIVEFNAAYTAEPKANPLVNIALCQKSLFNYPKAIAALETALAKHSATMSSTDVTAAQEAIGEMRGLLAYVLVRLSPPEAILTVDGDDQPAGTALKPVPLGPGTHKIGAHANGYGHAEESVTVASGDKGKLVVLRLSPDKGWIVLHGHDAKTFLFIDGKQVGIGQWADLLSPGQHVVQMTRTGMADYTCDVMVTAGKSLDVRPGINCAPHAGAPPPLPPPITVDVPPAPKKVEPPDPPVHGFFALVTGSLLFPTAHPKDFPNSPPTSGAAGGIRAGYRVNTTASFDLMFEYGNITAAGRVLSEDDVEYSLNSARFGLNLRLMTPGKKIRMVGTIGGGFAIDTLSEYRGLQTPPGGPAYCVDDCAGTDPFLLGELGAELEFGGVLVGLSAQSYFQSTKGMQTDGGYQPGVPFKPYDNDPLVFLGGGLRIGYGTW